MSKILQMNRGAGVLLVCALAWTMMPAAFAQETTAGIQGTVRDTQGAVVPGAAVEVTSPALVGSQKVMTDSAGYYHLRALPPGTYALTVSAKGFRTVRQTGIDLSAGRLPTIDVQLEVGSISETIEVSSAAPIVDVTQSKVAVDVSREVIDSLPKGRDAFSLLTLAPGARQEPLQSVGRGAGGLQGYQIDGASDSENVYLVDGMNTTNIQDGGVGKAFQTDFVQEVQIKSSSFEAEYGGAVGGVVNVIAQRGSNAWHGSVVTYFQLDGLNANDPCVTMGAGGTPAGFAAGSCGLRLDPNQAQLDTKGRLDGTPEYYVPKKDKHSILEPGFTLGGPLYKNRLFLFTSYIPTIDTQHRTVNFTGPNPGPRTFTRNFTQHNAYNRLDFSPFNSLKLYSSWNYAYSRTTGSALPRADSAYGQRNTGAGIDPATIRTDFGSVNPNSVYSFGVDWLATSKLVVSARFGYWFLDNQDRGRPQGLRYLFNNTVTAKDCTTPPPPPAVPACSRGLDGQPIKVGAQFLDTLYSNMSNNFQTLFDAYKRKDLHVSAAYFASHFLGTHNFKGGYDMMSQANDVLSGYNTAFVNINWADDYSPQTDVSACDAIMAANAAQYGPSAAGHCRGNVGYFTVQDGVDIVGKVSAKNHGLYVQDGWTMGHGLTLNVGVRFDKEFLPPYRAGADHISFGFFDKVAPRIGGAYDLFHDGKVKIYASYGKFFDIMKYGLPRGSFGGDYWRNCVYAMDDPAFTKITPTAPGGHSCGPGPGPAPGVTVGRFIEQVDLRKNVINTTDPGVDPKIKPMEQHEFVAGVDWAITPNWGLASRYARKRLDWAIEDIGITDNLGFYIGNPGTAFGDLLHRAAPGSDISKPLCPTCPAQPGAIRNYDGLEFRLHKRPGAGKWWAAINYTYSRLDGNYAGLTNSDPTDGSGGRHSPNNHRDFDWPSMQFTPSGAVMYGPLATDRPHTIGVFGFYRIPWFHQETLLSFNQAIYSGVPVNTCMAVGGTASSCQFLENRGNWVNFTRAANGDWQAGSIERDRRGDPFLQTNLSVAHEVKLGENENYRLRFEADVFNLFNQRAAQIYNEAPQATSKINMRRLPAFAGDPGFDWNRMLGGWDYQTEPNAERLTLSNRYGMPIAFQFARSMQLAIKFTF
jgi:hypothetical protein